VNVSFGKRKKNTEDAQMVDVKVGDLIAISVLE
jgi:hypothetical protein